MRYTTHIARRRRRRHAVYRVSRFFHNKTSTVRQMRAYVCNTNMRADRLTGGRVSVFTSIYYMRAWTNQKRLVLCIQIAAGLTLNPARTADCFSRKSSRHQFILNFFKCCCCCFKTNKKRDNVMCAVCAVVNHHHMQHKNNSHVVAAVSAAAWNNKRNGDVTLVVAKSLRAHFHVSIT